VPWSRVTALLAIEQRWYPATALDGLLEIEEGKINDTRLYLCLDRILPHKTKPERHLKERYGDPQGRWPVSGGQAAPPTETVRDRVAE
jgi:hypothetical protein